jgi:aryl-alcohol dehydrogenase-like predicted oxidoreductase
MNELWPEINNLSIIHIPGTTAINHLEENINAVEITFSEEELNFLS